MKKICVSSLCMILSLFSFAQEKQNEKEYKWGIGVQMNTIDKYFPYGNAIAEVNNFSLDPQCETNKRGISVGCLISYSLNENAFIRFKTGITSVKIKYLRDTKKNESNNGTYLLADGSAKQMRNYFAPSIIWQMKKSKFSFYGGFEIPFTIYQNYTLESKTTFYTDSTYSAVFGESHDITIIPGGYSVGAGAVGGFNVLFLKHFTLGSEFSAALLYSSLGGKVITTSPLIPGWAPYYDMLVKEFGNSSPMLSLNIAYSF